MATLGRPPAMPEQHTVTFLPTGCRVSVARDTTLLEAILDADLEISHTCGGRCTCGSCVVHVVRGHRALSRVGYAEFGHLPNRRSRLSCQSRVRGDVVVRIPPYQGPYGTAAAGAR